jgi:hypothetical protein
MKRLLVGVVVALATMALFATPALAGDGSTNPEQVPANVYFEDGDCDSLPTIDVESQEGVVYTLNGNVLPDTEFDVEYGTSGTVIATAEEGFEIVGPSEFPFGFTFDEETCDDTTTGGDTGGTTTGGDTGGTTAGGDTTGTGGVAGSGTGGTTGGTTGGVAGTRASGELPFTGLPIWVPLLLAGGLIGTGAFLLRRKAGAGS